ncbi:MAG: ATP-binding cassette domain-containing protein, partial [Clostridia bacterium]
RDMAMVFQNYALYGHMSVYDNMAFSLVLRKEKAEVIHKKVMAAAEILNLVDQLNKKPKDLSGGQRQRVAVGRAIVRNPKVFLFDEPLSNLDAKLRGSMRRELMLLHKKLNATMIYVTHDQIEALTLADRIVCMSNGYVQQVGTPLELYEKPTNLFVASFIGLPPMNFIDVVVSKGFVTCDALSVKLNATQIKLLSAYEGKEIVMGIRPEDIRKGNDSTLQVEIRENLGQTTLVHGNVNGKKIVCKLKEWGNYKIGEQLGIHFTREKMHFFDKETTCAIVEEKI